MLVKRDSSELKTREIYLVFRRLRRKFFIWREVVLDSRTKETHFLRNYGGREKT